MPGDGRSIDVVERVEKGSIIALFVIRIIAMRQLIHETDFHPSFKISRHVGSVSEQRCLETRSGRPKQSW